MPADWTARLFAKFQARYGRTWASQWPSDELQRLAIAEWSERLAGLTGEQIKRGLDTWDGDWPPSADQFRKACIGIRDDWEHRGAAYKRFPPSLPKPKADPDVVKAELEKMRQAMKA